MAVDYDLGKVAADIDMGRHDGNLSGVFDALRRRLAENGADFPWRIDLGNGLTFELEDMSGNALEAAEVAMGKSMHALNPEASIREWKSLVSAWLVNDRGWSEDEVIALVQQFNQTRIVESVSWREVNPSPKDTSGSRSSPETSQPAPKPAKSRWWRSSPT